MMHHTTLFEMDDSLLQIMQEGKILTHFLDVEQTTTQSK